MRPTRRRRRPDASHHLLDRHFADRASDTLPEVTAPEVQPTTPRGRPFEKGKSGDPNGRPRGARNKTTLTAEALLDGKVEALTNKLIDKALKGDMTAMRLCFERILPRNRDRAVAFNLPDIETAADARAASSAVLEECAAGTCRRAKLPL